MRILVLLLATASAVAAQIDTRELVRQSIVNGERAWEVSRSYSYVKQDAEKDFDSNGRVKSSDVDIYQVAPIAGDSYEVLVEHDGEPLPPDEAQQEQEALKKTIAARQAETPAQRARRLANGKKERAYYHEIPDAFNFHLIGEEDLPTGPAWVLEATPRPGFHAKTRYGKMFPKLRGKLWIDKKDLQWVKADAEATDNVYFGFFLARLAKGSHIILEQTRLPDGLWVPQRILAKASARTFLIFSHNFEEDITYSNYHKAGDDALSARK